MKINKSNFIKTLPTTLFFKRLYQITFAFFLFCVGSVNINPAYSGSLLQNGDFEKVGREPWDSATPGWGGYWSPDFSSFTNGHVPRNHVGGTGFPPKNGKTNLTHVGLSFFYDWLEGIYKSFIEPLTQGIEYTGGFFIMYPGPYVSNFNENVAGRANTVFAAIFRGPALANNINLSLGRYLAHIRFSTPIGSNINSFDEAYPADPADRDWHEFNGKFIAAGGESIYLLTAQPSKIYSYYFVDDLSLQCAPDAQFDFVKQHRYAKNGIKWQVATPPYRDVKPDTYWNAKTSFWQIIEVDEWGNPLNPLFSNSIERKDSPHLRENETYNISELINYSPGPKTRYFKLIHKDRCQDKFFDFNGEWEKDDFDWIIVPGEPKVKVKTTSKLCSDPIDVLTADYELTYEDSDIISVVATLKSAGNVKGTKTLDSTVKKGSVSFLNLHEPGDYIIYIELTYRSVFLNDIFSVKAGSPFTITLPKTTLAGPPKLTVGKTGQYDFSYEGAFPPQYVDWSHENELMFWKQDASVKGHTNFLYWIEPGLYSIMAKPYWYPKCIGEVTIKTLVEILKPVLNLTITPKTPCSQSGDLLSHLTIDDNGFKILNLTAELFEGSKSIQRITLDPMSRNISFPILNQQKPGSYKIKVTAEYEIVPGKNKTVEATVDFEIYLPTVSASGPQYLHLSENGTFNLITNVPQTPTAITWFYEDEDKIQMNGTSTIPQQILSWNKRGTYKVKTEVSWANECVGTGQTQVRVIGDATLYIPTGFTPTDDNNLNEEFWPVGLDMVITEFSIFNRYGQKIFEANPVPADIEEVKRWDGTYNGTNVQIDVYMFVVRAHTYDYPEKEIFKSGTVTVVR